MHLHVQKLPEVSNEPLLCCNSRARFALVYAASDILLKLATPYIQNGVVRILWDIVVAT